MKIIKKSLLVFYKEILPLFPRGRMARFSFGRIIPPSAVFWPKVVRIAESCFHQVPTIPSPTFRQTDSSLSLHSEASAGAPLVAANIKALLRRFAPAGPSSVLTFGELIVNANRRDVFVAGRAVRLSTIEFQLFWCLCRKPGLVVTRDEISLEIYHAAYNGYDRNIDLYVSRIRQKIGDDPTLPRYLKTVRGVGYQFVGE
jgi:hypothetical protein